MGNVLLVIVGLFLLTLVGTFFTVSSLNHIFGMNLVMDLPTYGAVLWLGMYLNGGSWRKS